MVHCSTCGYPVAQSQKCCACCGEKSLREMLRVNSRKILVLMMLMGYATLVYAFRS